LRREAMHPFCCFVNVTPTTADDPLKTLPPVETVVTRVHTKIAITLTTCCTLVISITQSAAANNVLGVVRIAGDRVGQPAGFADERGEDVGHPVILGMFLEALREAPRLVFKVR